MRIRGLCALLGVAAMVVGLGATTASAATIATFSDPAPNGDTPLFEHVGTMLTGGWSGTGLTLLTPASGGSYPNATFSMTPLTILDAYGTLSGGNIQFRDSSANLVLQIAFTSARLFEPFGFGASVFTAPPSAVTFSGPIITNPATLSDQTFAFSFANQAAVPPAPPDPGGYSWTAAFTSSAVPEPASLMLLAIGGLLASRWRR